MNFTQDVTEPVRINTATALMALTTAYGAVASIEDINDCR